MEIALIDRCLQKDKENDMFRRLMRPDESRNGSISMSGMRSNDYPNHDQAFGVPFFNKIWHYPFPQELKDQFKHMQSNFATGILPSIFRAWMAIDSDLFLWNFENNRDLAFYDAINNTILAVEVVAPKEGVSLPPQLHSILVVSTTVDIELLGISFRDSNGKILSPGCGDLKNASAYMMGNAPIFKLSLDGLNVTNICTTKNGRIFFSANEDLYELNYNQKNWMGGPTCSKTNHSKSLIDYLIPALTIFNTKDEIRQLAVDDSRNIIFVLLRKGSIQVFDMGDDGLSLKKFTVFHRNELEHIGREQCNVSAELFYEIVQVTVVPKEQSSIVNLIATTSKGVRVYFSCYKPNKDMTQSSWRPQTFYIVHIRFPPDVPFIDSMPHDVQIYYTNITVDSAFLASAPDGNETNLWALSSSIFSLSSQFYEFVSSAKIRGTIWKIARLKQTSLNSRRDGEANIRLLNPNLPLMLEQYLCSYEKVFLLTSQGVYVYQHFSPLETFRNILHNYGAESKQFRTFASNVDPVELCVMALSVLCSELPADHEIRDIALRVFFSYGSEQNRLSSNVYMMSQSRLDESMLKDGHSFQSSMINGRSSSLGLVSPKIPLRSSTPHDSFLNGSVGVSNGHAKHLATPMSIGAADDHSIIAGSIVQNSPRHNAIFTYFSRVVKDIWHKILCQPQNNIVYSSLEEGEIDLVGQLLSSLLRAIDEYSLVSATSSHHFHHALISQSPRNINNIGALQEQEKQATQKLRIIIVVTNELLALWRILLEHELSAIFSMLPTNIQKFLLDWDLESLVRNRSEVNILYKYKLQRTVNIYVDKANNLSIF